MSSTLRRRSVVSYLRESSPGQAADHKFGLIVQRTETQSLASHHGLTIDEEYVEVHRASENDDFWDRRVFSSLRRDIEAGKIDTVVIQAFDRLHRDAVFQQTFLRECARYGVRVLCVHDQIPEGEDDELVGYVRGYSAKKEAVAIKRRTQSGRKARVASGKPLPGPKPMYGYRWFDESKSRLVTHPLEALIVERIFREYALGQSCLAIAQGLTRDGIATPTGGTIWRNETVRQILHRPHYTGHAIGWVNRNDTKNGRYTSSTQGIALPEGVYPAIIDMHTFERVQERLKSGHQTRRRAMPNDALLRSGRAICGHCGRPMYSRWWKRRYQNYACNGDIDRPGQCLSPTISVRKLDGLVWSNVETLLKRPEVILAELDRLTSDDTPVGRDIAMLDRRLRDEERRLSNLSRRVADLDDDAVATVLVDQMKVVNRTIKELQAEREKLAVRHQDWEQTRASASQLERWVERMRETVSDLPDEEKRLLIEALDIRVRVYRQGHDPRVIVDGAVPLDDIALTRGTCRRHCRC